MNTKLALNRVAVKDLQAGDYIVGPRETVIFSEPSNSHGKTRLLLENYKGIKRAVAWGNRTMITIERGELPGV